MLIKHWKNKYLKNVNQAFENIKCVYKNYWPCIQQVSNFNLKNNNQTFENVKMCMENMFTIFQKNNLILYLKTLNQAFEKCLKYA